MKSFYTAVLASGLSLLAFAKPIQAQWINPNGGIYGETSNWQGGNIPSGSTAIRFAAVSMEEDITYTVTLDKSYAGTGGLISELGNNVTIDLNG